MKPISKFVSLTVLNIIIISSYTFGQAKKPTLNESLNWLVTKLIAYSQDGKWIKDQSYKPRFGSNVNGDYVVFKTEYLYNKPDFNYDIQNGVIIMQDNYRSNVFNYEGVSSSYWDSLDYSGKAKIRNAAKWELQPPRTTKYFFPFKFLSEASYDATQKTLIISATGNFVRTSDNERYEKIELYFNIYGEQDLLNRINNAIGNIKRLTQSAEAF